MLNLSAQCELHTFIQCVEELCGTAQSYEMSCNFVEWCTKLCKAEKCTAKQSNVVQFCGMVCNFVQSCAKVCKAEQCSAKQMYIVQFCAKQSKNVQFCGVVCTFVQKCAKQSKAGETRCSSAQPHGTAMHCVLNFAILQFWTRKKFLMNAVSTPFLLSGRPIEKWHEFHIFSLS